MANLVPPMKYGRLIFELKEVPNSRKYPAAEDIYNEGEPTYTTDVTIGVFYDGFSVEDQDARSDALYMLDRVIYQALMSDKNPPMKRWEGKL